MRILAIDPGDRRIGLAVSDKLCLTAQPLATFDRKMGKSFFRHLEGLVIHYNIGDIVVGHPLALSGRKTTSGNKAETLALKIREALDVKVTLWDERLTSVEANRVLKGSRAGKDAVDKIAAVLLLQNYLDYLHRQS